jgi:hypothetical protein
VRSENTDRVIFRTDTSQVALESLLRLSGYGTERGSTMQVLGTISALGNAWQALVTAANLLNSKLTGVKSTTLTQQLHAIHAKANVLAQAFGHSEVELQTWLELQQTMCVFTYVLDIHSDRSVLDQTPRPQTPSLVRLLQHDISS